MALLYDWVAETANSPGTSTNVSLLGALNGSYKTFASKAANGSQVYYTISDETSMRECGIGTFTSPSTVSRDTVLANTLGTTARMNFVGPVVVYCEVPASKALFLDAAGTLATLSTLTVTGALSAGSIALSGQIVQSGSPGWTNTISAGNGQNALLLNQTPTGTDTTGLVVNLRAITSFHCIWQFGGVTKGSINTNGTTTNYNTTSDSQLKIDDGIIGAKDAGHIIDSLKPRWFRWKETPEKPSETGFFAQEVHEVVPKAVSEGRFVQDPDDEEKQVWVPWAMDEAKLMSAVVAELQALRTRVKELEDALSLSKSIQ